MPQHLCDFWQRSSISKHLRGGSVAQSMGPEVCESYLLTGTQHDAFHAVGAEPPMGRPHAKEKLTRPGARAAAFEVGDKSLSNVGGQRQAVLALKFSLDKQLPACPVRILQSEFLHLTDPQPK